MGPLDHEIQRFADLTKKRGVCTVLSVSTLPGKGLEILCRLPIPGTPWNVLGHHLLQAFSKYPQVNLRFNRTLVQRGGKTLEGGTIQFWGPLPEVLQSLCQVVETMPAIRPSEVTEATLANPQFYAPSPTGGGAYDFGKFEVFNGNSKKTGVV